MPMPHEVDRFRHPQARPSPTPGWPPRSWTGSATTRCSFGPHRLATQRGCADPGIARTRPWVGPLLASEVGPLNGSGAHLVIVIDSAGRLVPWRHQDLPAE